MWCPVALPHRDANGHGGCPALLDGFLGGVQSVLKVAEAVPREPVGRSERVWVVSAPVLSDPRYDDYVPAGERRALLDRLAPHAAVLDVGCWSGSVGRYLMSQLDAAVDGIEPDPEMARLAGRDYRDVYAGTFEEALGDVLKARTGLYDAVLFLDVLEHLPDPLPSISQARQLLGPGGRALV